MTPAAPAPAAPQLPELERAKMVGPGQSHICASNKTLAGIMKPDRRPEKETSLSLIKITIMMMIRFVHGIAKNEKKVSVLLFQVEILENRTLSSTFLSHSKVIWSGK